MRANEWMLAYVLKRWVCNSVAVALTADTGVCFFLLALFIIFITSYCSMWMSISVHILCNCPIWLHEELKVGVRSNESWEYRLNNANAFVAIAIARVQLLLVLRLLYFTLVNCISYRLNWKMIIIIISGGCIQLVKKITFRKLKKQQSIHHHFDGKIYIFM